MRWRRACRIALETLKADFTRDFWLEDDGMVALALDGDKKPCRVMSSNSAHCLAAGLLDRDQESATLAKRLMADDMFSGWGVRTLSSQRPPLQSDELSQWIGLAARQCDRGTRARRGSRAARG